MVIMMVIKSWFHGDLVGSNSDLYYIMVIRNGDLIVNNGFTT